MSVRRRIAYRLHVLADRIDQRSAFRLMTTLNLTLERGKGWTLREDGRGIPIWYRGHTDYDRAHTEADNLL